jgi:7-cyano-7-deazaguanine synthase
LSGILPVVHQSRTCTVLLSGGIDSAVLAALLVDARWLTAATWIDLGQPAAASERRASLTVAAHLGLPWSEHSVTNLNLPKSGEIPGRNDLLVGTSLAANPGTSVAIGIHAGTPYSDNSPGWVGAWNRLADLQYGGTIQLLAPLVDMTRADVITLGRDLNVPMNETHSCEAANIPCGMCASCRDRIGANVD